MTEFTPPILVFDGLDLSIYGSLESMAAGLEGVDVEDGVYEAFDSIGHTVRLAASGVRRGRFTVDIGETRVDLSAPLAIDERRLGDLLRAHLRAVGQELSDEAALSEMVASVLARHRQDSRR